MKKTGFTHSHSTNIFRCEIINIGSELVAGRQGASSQVVAEALSSIGIKVSRITTVPDDVEELTEVFSEALKRSRIVFTVGGLGSTPDDVTRDVLSSSLNIKLKFSRKAMENVARYFSALGKEVPKSCDNQADILEDASILSNMKGSCPGQLLNVADDKLLIMLPGPKEEIEYIIGDSLLNILKEKYEIRIKKSTIIHVIGLCEIEVSDKLRDILETERHLEKSEIEFYFMHNINGVDLEVVCWGDNELLVEEMLHKTKNEIYAELKDYIYGEDKDTIEAVLGKLCTKNRKTLAIAESCTGGMLASRITDAAGSSIYFKQAAVVYSSNAKIKILGVNAETIRKYTAVSEEVAREMADNMKKISGADYVLSVTGYAGPSANKDLFAKPGTGYIGLACPEMTKIKKVEFSGTRIKVKEKFTAAALEMLWHQLKEESKV